VKVEERMDQMSLSETVWIILMTSTTFKGCAQAICCWFSKTQPLERPKMVRVEDA
jgi:hypothetical protein